MHLCGGGGLNLKLQWLSMGYDFIFVDISLHLFLSVFPCWKHFGSHLTAPTPASTAEVGFILMFCWLVATVLLCWWNSVVCDPSNALHQHKLPYTDITLSYAGIEISQIPIPIFPPPPRLLSEFWNGTFYFPSYNCVWIRQKSSLHFKI